MNLFLLIVILLFVVAIIDLIVGVSNDAVNFLNSAIGSKVASFRTILIVASLGVLLGSVFSTGIMEVARKGIFNPEFFTFDRIMFLFLAVMLTDIILLDFFNSIGLPTSTTVSIVFELLGAAVMMGLLITIDKQQSLDKLGDYINTKKAIEIILGIFLSIIVAFTLGAIVQYLSRLWLSFDYEKNLKRYGALFSGVAITAITYFLLIKGLKGSPFNDSAFYSWVTQHTAAAVAILFVFWTLTNALLMRFANANPLRITVLAGTFALAMAFAGNDLVNFIGVPIAAYASFTTWKASGISAESLHMDFLAGEVTVPPFILILAGVIMAVTLWLSSKARKVTETEVNLSRQDEAAERFKPNGLARFIVKSSLMVGERFGLIVPPAVSRKIEERFHPKYLRETLDAKEQPAFDLVRAAVNLMMASIVIAFATSKKIPLSTTYVSFMVAMGTSMADRAWGRESAVYRVAGVLSVVAGWLMTAVVAFTVSAIFALLLFKFKLIGIIVLSLLALAALITSHVRFSKKDRSQKEDEHALADAQSVEELITNSRTVTAETMVASQNAYQLCLAALKKKNVGKLEKADDAMTRLLERGFKRRKKAIRHIKQLESQNLEIGHLYLLASDLLQDMSQSAKSLTDETLYYIKNLHPLPNNNFFVVVNKLEEEVPLFLQRIALSIERFDASENEKLIEQRKAIRQFINEKLREQVKSIQIEGMSTRQAILQTEILLQSRDIIAIALRLYKLYRNFKQRLS